MAERIAEQVPRGSQICVQGKLSPATWTNREGKQQTKFKVHRLALFVLTGLMQPDKPMSCVRCTADHCWRGQIRAAAATESCSSTAKQLGTAAAAGDHRPRAISSELIVLVTLLCIFLSA